MSLVERALQKLQQSARPPGGHRSVEMPEPAVAPSSAAESNRTAETQPLRALQEAPPAVKRPERVVTLDREQLRQLRLLPPVQAERRIAAQFQIIKRPLVAASQKTEPGAALTLMVASALPGEGKTFTSINLALSLALEPDIEVLLVDADVRKPHLSKIFGVEHEPGLLELLFDGSMHPNQVIMDTTVPRLSLMPAGRPVDTATELLSSKRMADIVAQLAVPGGRRIVLFDSPPLLLSTESHALSAHMDQIVLVVRADVTPQKAVLSAIDTLPEDRQVSLILNQSTAAVDISQYGYGNYGDVAEAASAG
jgi:protein-tyrosine kinase